MNKRLLAVGVVGGLGWYAWRVFSAPVYVDTLNGEAQSGQFIAVANDLINEVGYMASGSVNENLMPSFNLLAYLKDYEKLALNEYIDETGNLTIGYGHKVLKNEDFSKGISKDLAETIFANDVTSHAEIIYTSVKVPLNQNQFDALVSFVFNVGVGAFKKSTLLKVLNSGDYSQAGNEFMKWVYGTKTINGVKTKVVIQGLYNRRYSDMRVYLNGIYKRFNG